jgi:hypothetical protein
MAGIDRAVVSTRIRPRGLAGAIPARASNVMHPLYPYLTGFTDPVEVQPNGVCDDPPTAGQMKNCLQTATYGRYGYQSREIDLSSIGEIINRSEFTDLTLVNNPLGTIGGPAGITWPDSAGSNISLLNEVVTRFAEVGIKFQNKLMRQFWEGNPANNTGGGGYKEFPGLDRLIGTGKVDAETGVACPTLDSLVLDMNYRKIDDLSGNGYLINVLTYALRLLKNKAERSGLAPVEFALVMREGLFYELTAIWPCNYLTARCAGFNNGNVSTSLNLDAGDIQQLRDSMRNENYLVIDGTRYNVILDDALNEETSGDTNRVPGTCFASDIKIVPMSVLGGTFAGLFWEYFDWNGPGAAMNVANDIPLMNNWFWTDGGRYLWHMKPPQNWCVQWLGLIRPRLILRTPHLAASINNVVYCPLMHEADSFPDDPYFTNGGNTTRDTAPSLYKSWT